MNANAHEIIRSLLELASLEDRLEICMKRHLDGAPSLRALIESLRANLPVGVLIVHDKMRTQGRRCVAEVHHGVCSGCHLALATGNLAALSRGEMHRCGNCGRYLHLLDPEEAFAGRLSPGLGPPGTALSARGAGGNQKD